MAKIHGKMLYFPFSAINRGYFQSSFSLRSREEKEAIYHWSSINRKAGEEVTHSSTQELIPTSLKIDFFAEV